MLKPFRTANIDFQEIQEIGQNGKNSKTHLVFDPQLNSNIVVKTIEKNKIASVNEFFSEAQLLHASAHPHVAQIHYACYDNDNVYIAMPHYTNGSIKELITGKHISVRHSITLATQILSALHNIHSKGLIHFDIKPDNILLSNRLEALVTDFGLAKQTNQYGQAMPAAVYGRMFPPEAFAQQPILDKRFDIYQFGVTLYRMCIGNDAFYAQFEAYRENGVIDQIKLGKHIIEEKFPDRKIFPAHIPNALRSVIKKCMKANPDERYQSAIDVVNALSKIDGPQLDWVLDVKNGVRTWEKMENGVKLTFSVNAANITHGSRTSEQGVTRKKNDWCKVNASDKDLYDILAT